MKTRLLVSTAAAFIAICGAASAAPAVNWTGWYVGAHAGTTFAKSDWTDIVVPSDSGQDMSGTYVHNQPQGFVGGVHGGYNYQNGNWVVGVEGDFSGSSLSGKQKCFGNWGDYSADCTSAANWSADIAARVGMTWGPSLIYLKTGAAFLDAQITPANQTPEGPAGHSDGYKTSETVRSGWLFGVGADYALDSHWSVGAEYDYSDFGKDSVTFTPNKAGQDASPPFKSDVSMKDVQTLKLRVNYRF